MKALKYIIVMALMCTLPAQRAIAGYGWDEVANSTLRAQMLNYAKTFQNDVAGTPASQIVSDFIEQVYAKISDDDFAWLDQTHRVCNQLEAIYPPLAFNPLTDDLYSRIRQGILRLRDFPCHAKSETHFINSFNENFVAPAKQGMIEYLASARPAEGEIDCYKVYSSGFIFRTSKHTLGIDIGCITNDETAQSGASLEAIANGLDVYILTHAHGDHYSPEIVNALLAKGKKVILPKKNIANIKSGATIWDAGNETGDTFSGIKICARMSAQGDEPCLIYHVDMDGYYIAHVGDNSIHDNETFYEKQEIPDFLIAPIFQGLATLFNHVKVAKNANSRSYTYISAHENELHHGPESRVSYQWFYKTCINGIVNPPMMLMVDTGESFTYKR